MKPPERAELGVELRRAQVLVLWTNLAPWS